MKKLKIDWFYFKFFLLFILVVIMAFNAGIAKSEGDQCGEIIKEAKRIVYECNEIVRQCNKIPQEFNLSSLNFTWKIQ